MNRPGSWFSPTPLLLVTCSLLACGGGNGGPTGPVTGSLAVAVSGLPGGASASVSVTGPGGFARTLTASQTISNLAPGGYTLSHPTLRSAARPTAPTPASQSVTVNEGDTPAAGSRGIRDRQPRPDRHDQWPAPRHLGGRDGDRAGWLLPERLPPRRP